MSVRPAAMPNPPPHWASLISFSATVAAADADREAGRLISSLISDVTSDYQMTVISNPIYCDI